MMRWSYVLLFPFGALSLACSDEAAKSSEKLDWSFTASSSAAAFTSVHGTAEDDVWVVGANDGQGPVLLHFDGESWERKPTDLRADIWWVQASKPGGPVYFGGQNASILRYENGEFARLETPGLGKDTVYGVWAAAPDDVYAVGASAGKNGFIWHYDGSAMRALEVPADLPENEDRDQPGLFKVSGSSADDVWISGASGTLLRGNAQLGFHTVRAGGDAILFTVNARGNHVVAVGGTSSAFALEGRGAELSDRTPDSTPLLQGAFIDAHDRAWAVGVAGTILRGEANGFRAVDSGLDFQAGISLHSVWVSPQGGVWAVGGDVLTPKLDRGIAIHAGGQPVPEFVVPPPVAPAAVCPEAAIDPQPKASIARRWNEQILGAIRRDLPRPGVHARNLFHLSAAFWDAYAAYDEQVTGYVTKEHLAADDLDEARTEALSYAAYRVLHHRYSKAVGGDVSQACFDAFMDKLGFDPLDTSSAGAEPRALGNRIGQAIIEAFANDGANEDADYADPSGFEPDSPNLIVDRPGAHTDDPTAWQRLVLARAETQNGIPANAGAQSYIGGQWGDVRSFALVRSHPDAPYFDPGNLPSSLDEALTDAAIDVLRLTSELDVEDDTVIDISPRALGNNPLGSADGTGYAQNPVTGQPYAAARVKRSDFGRVLAEFWADGPTSETPPGHWNVLANHVADDPSFERKLFGQGTEMDRLSWDVHVYLALNGALHDAAIACWDLKRRYVSARPITLIRYMAEKGQRSDPDAPSYDPEGLPLIEGLIELITEDSSAPGERHEALHRYVGEVAVRGWRGEPGDRKTQIGGVGWIRGVEWIPYQRRTFVTPAFPGYVSGHSTFSRAAAEVLGSLTGSEFFPGGLGSYDFEPGYLFFEKGPSAKVRLQWATYFDAADQAGLSRRFGGIHISFDDFDGRRLGAWVGESALARVRPYFGEQLEAP